MVLNYLVVSRFERRGFILHTQKKVVALPYVTSYAKNGSKLQWFPPCPRHVDSIKIKQNHAWHNGIKFYLMKYLFLYFPFSKEIFKIFMPWKRWIQKCVIKVHLLENKDKTKSCMVQWSEIFKQLYIHDTFFKFISFRA